jgi:NADH-quinone oxidoreductase subunit H
MLSATTKGFSRGSFSGSSAFFIFMMPCSPDQPPPFDLPESEQELAGGYNVEYSSMKFALFFMGEYASMTTGAAMMVTLFLGGWTLPFAGLDHPAATPWVGLLHIGIFLAKMLFVVFMIIWVRWMWPRFRYDQLMDLGWRRFIPLALANIIITAIILWWRTPLAGTMH